MMHTRSAEKLAREGVQFHDQVCNALRKTVDLENRQRVIANFWKISNPDMYKFGGDYKPITLAEFCPKLHTLHPQSLKTVPNTPRSTEILDECEKVYVL